ncbi:glycosyltransferase involved in cell wall biosynthesis [Herbinix hemicellulosilytica]|uniref:Bactoprenol glucosyl transferase homolog from prophage CPS-53 n=1 Tax=Herbinix hemicellulosilytica TaxID=1564487 RepID=A0A0H5SD37_HERHM|nr:glycosyltransferase family 2 protein [Herbinix hemicellulosilytica]RBP57833.1 glycosyltransferase involved in cell wall biosynthesis [Herbinix hemicellulosilytica]CRZ33334.1 Bactoprenol glucosyl transferase homolog from prophage CPS-53 [Herbinix hemicellulosilytica]
MEVLSVVVPCFNEEEVLPLFYDEIAKVAGTLNQLQFEFLFVNDGSSDGTLEVIKKFRKKDERVHYVSFSRNFGKEAAIYAGLKKASGDYVVIMDADLQDPPSLIAEMYKAVKYEGFDCVATKRSTREGEPPVRSFFARCFYRLFNKISKIEIMDGARDYRFMTRQVVDAILSMTEYNRFSKGIFSWVGFKTKWLEYSNIQRAAGKTKWSFWKLFLYSIEGITAFSTVPLAFASVFGIIFCFLAFLMIIVIIIKTVIWGDPTSGWPSLVCIICMLSGVQMLCIGILGQYLAKTYLESKNRPVYIIKEEE